MKYYVNPYPNPRAADGETSGYWQRRSQVFGKPILNPNPEKVDLDGDGIVEALQQSERAIRPAKPIASESGLVSFAGRKPGRKINFDKTEIGADGKITLELTANDIDRLVQDLSHLGGENIATFGRNASVTIDASKLAELESLESLAFGHTPKPNKPQPQLPSKPKDGKRVSFDKADVDGNGKIALDLVANDINQLVRDLYDIGVDGIITFGNNASVKIDASKIPALEQLPSLAFGRTTQRVVPKGGEETNPAKSKKGKTWEEIEAEGRAIVESYTKGIIVNPGNTWGGAYMLPGGDSARDLVPGTPPRITAEEWLKQGSKRKGSEESKDNRGTKNKSQTKMGNSASQNNRETNPAGVVPLSAPKEASQDNKGADLSVDRVKKFPSETTPSTTIISRAASFENQSKQPAGLTRNAFGQPIQRPSFTSISHTVGGSSSGGSSNSQVRAGSSSSRGSSGGGDRVQVAPGASSSRGTSGGGGRVQVAPEASYRTIPPQIVTPKIIKPRTVKLGISQKT